MKQRNKRAVNLVHKVHEAIKGEEYGEIIIVLACGIGIALRELDDDDERDYLLAAAVRCITKEINQRAKTTRRTSPKTQTSTIQ